MSLIQVKSIYKNFIDKVILNDVSFAIENADKIGFVGLNGTGKTTFIKILMGEEESDNNPKTHEEGVILKSPNLTIGYVSQHNVLDENASVFEELFEVYNLKEVYKNLTLAFSSQDMEAISELTADFEYGDGYKNQSNIEKTLEGIGIKEDIWHSKISSLSGGEQKKVALAKILLKEPDLLILDEPTNHLDLEAIEWLEDFLIKYKKAFILISHDAYLLNNTTNKTMELERGKLRLYSGNYDSFLAQKELYLASSKKEYDKEQEKIENLKEFVDKYKAGVKSKQAMGRQKLLERITPLENPIVVNKKIKLKFQILKPNAKEVLTAEELGKKFNDTKLFDKISFKVFQKDRIAILGKNGCGKSTLLKMLTGELSDYSGNINFGINTKIGYYDQHNHNLNPKNTILEEIYTNYPITEEEARNIAGSFLFSQDDVLKKISSLSGGEKARVSLIKLSLEKPNLLILDEPTNHLDIYSRRVLEKALKEYEGVILFVSHDRSFIEKITNKIVSFNKNTIKVFKGNYFEYKKTLK